MIANISPNATSIAPIFDYNERKVEAGEAMLLEMVNIPFSSQRNARNTAINTMLLQANQSKRKNKFLHVSLNFPSADMTKLNDETYIKIAKEYMEKMGYSSTHPFAIYKHNDTNHPHIHIVSTRINEKGKFIDDSNERKRSQAITRELEIKYQLTKVSSKKQNVTYEMKAPDINAPLKEKLSYYIEKALKQERVTTYTELKEYLNERNLDFTQVQGTRTLATGEIVAYSGLIYNAIGNDFKQNQRSIKASALYSKPTEANLEKQFKYNLQYVQKEKNFIRESIDTILAKYELLNIEDYKKQLAKKGIDVHIKFDTQGQLVGLSYERNNQKYTGEQIGKSYTAKNMRIVLGTFESQYKPEIITKNDIKFYYPHIKNIASDKTKELELLVAIGMKLSFKDGFVLVSNYKNPKGKGFVKFCDLKDINLYKIRDYILVNQITFTEQDASFYKHNRDMLLGRKNIENNNKYQQNNIERETVIGEIKEQISTYNDEYIANEVGKDVEKDIISDLDRPKIRKKKPAKKGVRRRM